MAAALEAARLIREGCRYRDITLVVTDMASYAGPAEMIFRRMGIPLYQAGTQDILRQSVIATVIAALEAADSDFEPKAMQRYLRSACRPGADRAISWKIMSIYGPSGTSSGLRPGPSTRVASPRRWKKSR